MQVDVEGVGGGGAGGVGELGGLAGGVANLTLFTFGFSSGFFIYGCSSEPLPCSNPSKIMQSELSSDEMAVMSTLSVVGPSGVVRFEDISFLSGCLVFQANQVVCLLYKRTILFPVQIADYVL